MARDYWMKRAEADMDAVQDAADARLTRIGRAMMHAQNTLTEEAEKILGNYMKRYRLTREKALELMNQPLTYTEWERLRGRVTTLPDGPEKREMSARMSRSAYRYRITRVEALRINIAIETAKTAQGLEDETTQQLRWTAVEAYQRAMFSLQEQEGSGFAMPDLKGALQSVGSRWAGSNYSARVWTNRDLLAETLREKITDGYLTGKSTRRVAQEIQDAFSVSFHRAETVVRTETSYEAGKNRRKAYLDAGRKRYRFLATLDSKTCKKCGPLDNQVLPLDKIKVGVNYPPMHPNCRCTTVPIVEGREGAGKYRRGIGADGKSMLLPKDMHYEEWKAWQAAGCPMDVEGWLQKERVDDIMSAQGSDPVSIQSPIGSPIESRSSDKGKTYAVLHYARPLNNRQQRLLDQLPSYDSRVIVRKHDIKISDLSALTAETGVEYAAFTRRGERLAIRGGKRETNIGPEDARIMKEDGWRWSAHTHPGTEQRYTAASDGDYAVLAAFGQKRSVIQNSVGMYEVFEGD